MINLLIKWNELNLNEVKNNNSKSSIVMLNISSCEQHANHLPVGTDAFLGREVSEASAIKSDKNIYFLSTIEYGFSQHHMNFPGSITLTQNTLINLIKDIIHSVYKSGFRNMVIINSHGGNHPSIQVAVNEIGGVLPDLNVVALKYWDFISEEICSIRESEMGGIGHAGELETSLMLYLKPELVNEQYKFDYPVSRDNNWYNPDMFAKNKIYQYKPFDYYSKYGNIGEPKYATPEKGELMFNIITNKISKFLNEYF